MSYASSLYNFIKESPEIGYNDSNKRKFKKVASDFLKEVGKDFESTHTIKHSYLKGGPAVGGDVSMKMMPKSGDGRGIYIVISQPMALTNWTMARSIKNFYDHTGGPNRWLHNSLLIGPEKMVEHIRNNFTLE